ncbi:MAG: anaerobic ribonucleoside-triphosphate reductase activating protein [Clostridia bacterium]|nr:anaerobic ribonucleoside-triphosphate reductase activating protein [Clostridia bacterium]
MNVQGYQKMTLLDFPGRVACTVFTGGCNLRCPFCHNADLVRHPLKGASMETEVLEYLAKRRGLIDGVCVTGGEPLLQPDLVAFLQKLKDMGYLVKLDTNGMLPQRLSEVLRSGLLDYVAMDVKSSPDGYAKAVGCDVDVAVFEKSIRLIQESGIAHEFRTTAVKGIHTVDDFSAIGRWLGRDELYFIQGFQDSGNLLASGCQAFSHAETEEILAAAKQYLPRAAVRGSD